MSTELAVNEWSKFEAFVATLRADLLARRQELAAWLGRMSSTQLAKAKPLLRFLCNADAVERLAMAGRGEISIEQASLQLSARIWRGLPATVRQHMQPELEVEVLTNRGVILKPLARLNDLEANQVLDLRSGPKPAEKQRILPPPAALPKGSEPEELESLRLLDGKHVLIRGKHGSTIKVPTKTLRQVLN